MSEYNLPQLIQMWQQESITVEQAIGQLFLHLDKVVTRLGQLERQRLSKPPIIINQGKTNE